MVFSVIPVCVCNVCFHRRRRREQFVLHRVLSTDVVNFSLSLSLVVELEDPEHHSPASRATVARESKENKNRLCSMTCGIDKIKNIDRLDTKSSFIVEGSKRSFI